MTSKDAESESSGESSPLHRASPGELADVLRLITHDLRNPLAALASNVGFLHMVKGQVSEEVQETLADLELSTEAMSRIVDAMELLCSELREASSSPASNVSVASLLAGMKGHCDRGARSRGVELLYEFADARDLLACVSEVHFSRALSALVHNALTVAPAGSAVIFRVRPQGDELIFEVEDQGPRLPASLREVALSAVGQVQIKTHAAGRYSRGLGLYAVARAASLAGARFTLPEGSATSVMQIVAARAS